MKTALPPKGWARKAPAKQKATLRDLSRVELEKSTGYLIRDVYRLELRALADRLAARGTVVGAWFYLRVLWNDDGITQRELGRRIGVNDATVGYALEGLKRMKLVTRQRAQSDRRKILVFLTPKGRELGKQLLPVARDINKIILSGFSVAEAAQFSQYLKRARSNLEKVAENFTNQTPPDAADAPEGGRNGRRGS
jgi:DNA-binding MarR family transcriptional regulator